MSRRIEITIDGVKQPEPLWDLCENFAILIYQVDIDGKPEEIEERASLLTLVERANLYNENPSVYKEILVLTHEAYQQFLAFNEQKQIDNALNEMIENDPSLAELADLI